MSADLRALAAEAALRVLRGTEKVRADEVAPEIADAVLAATRRLPDELRGDGPCGDCGTLDNIIWFTESVFWNAVMRPPGYEGEPLLCIPCFVIRADAAGYYPTGWRLLPDWHWETRTERDRRLAAAAPPAGLSATVPAGDAPAVPEEADGQRAGEGDALTYAEMEAERDRLAGEVFTLTNSESLDVVAAELERDEARADRDRLVAQVAQFRRVVEAAKAWRGNRYASASILDLAAAVDALSDAGTQPCPTPSDAKSDAGPHQHECACNAIGDPAGVCEEPPRQGVWRLTCGAENIPPNQTYATKGAAEDVMRLHDGACPGTHGVEFVPDAGTDQTEDDRGE